MDRNTQLKTLLIKVFGTIRASRPTALFPIQDLCYDTLVNQPKIREPASRS